VAGTGRVSGGTGASVAGAACQWTRAENQLSREWATSPRGAASAGRTRVFAGGCGCSSTNPPPSSYGEYGGRPSTAWRPSPRMPGGRRGRDRRRGQPGGGSDRARPGWHGAGGRSRKSAWSQLGGRSCTTAALSGRPTPWPRTHNPTSTTPTCSMAVFGASRTPSSRRPAHRSAAGFGVVFASGSPERWPSGGGGHGCGLRWSPPSTLIALPAQYGGDDCPPTGPDLYRLVHDAGQPGPPRRCCRIIADGLVMGMAAAMKATAWPAIAVRPGHGGSERRQARRGLAGQLGHDRRDGWRGRAGHDHTASRGGETPSCSRSASPRSRARPPSFPPGHP